MPSLYQKIKNPNNLYRKNSHTRNNKRSSAQSVLTPTIKVKKTSDQRVKRNPFSEWVPMVMRRTFSHNALKDGFAEMLATVFGMNKTRRK